MDKEGLRILRHEPSKGGQVAELLITTSFMAWRKVIELLCSLRLSPIIVFFKLLLRLVA